MSAADEASVKIAFGTEDYDTDGYFTLGDPTKFTIPADGYYHFTAAIAWSDLGVTESQLRVHFIVDDDNSYGRHDQYSNGAALVDPVDRYDIEADLHLLTGQIVEIQVRQSSGATQDAKCTGFSVFRMSSGPQGPTGPEGISVPVGGIIMWSGTIASIPAPWALCDGTANSPGPDLRDKFIVGATSDDAGVAKTNLTGALTASGAAAVSAHSLSTSVALSAHSRTTDVALSAHTLSTNVAIANHALSTASARTSNASTIAAVTTTGPTHTITQPVVGNHSITQPVFADHTITQPVVAAHTSNWPSYYALAFIQRMS